MHYRKIHQLRHFYSQEFLRDVLDSVRLEIENIKKANLDIKIAGAIICPRCKKGHLRRIRSGKGTFYGCSEFSNGCKFTAIEKNGKPVLVSNK